MNPDSSPAPPAPPTNRNAWLTTAASAGAVAVLLLAVTHGRITSLYGIAAIISLANAALCAHHAGRHINISATTRRRTVLATAALTGLTGLVIVTALLTHQ